MRSVRQSLKDEGFAVLKIKLCRWFEVTRGMTYCKPAWAPVKVSPELVTPVKEMI